MVGTEYTRGAAVGPYTLSERLYRGSGREAWRAEGAEGAVTLCIATGGDRAGLTREEELLVRLDHPAALRVQASHVDADPPWLEVAWPAGRLLRDALRPRPLKVADALALTRELAGLLAHAHARGVFGPDLRPAAVVLSDQGPVVAGWSTAWRAGPSVATGEVPPAQRDVAALGALLYSMLTGARGDDEPLDPGEPFAQSVRDLVRDLTGPVDGRPKTAREISYRVRGLLNEPDALRDPPPPKLEFTPRESMMRGARQLGPPPPPELYGFLVTPTLLTVAVVAALGLITIAASAAWVLWGLLS
jgi:serine/threonine protein kinase